MSDSAPRWLVPDWPADVAARVRVISTLRPGGRSRGSYSSLNLARHVGDDPAAVTANRALLRDMAALPGEPLWLEQVHGIAVVGHRGVTDASPPRADAVALFEPGRVGAVMTADCLPVAFADRDGCCAGVAHAGWRGLADGVLESTVESLRVAPDRLVAWLGPAISQAAFEVGPEVRDAFLARDADHREAFAPNAAGRWQADLYALARRTLRRAGVTEVYGGGRCTAREETDFFSFRRDGGRTGRMATLAWLATDDRGSP
jgi:YfiH family protein